MRSIFSLLLLCVALAGTAQSKKTVLKGTAAEADKEFLLLRWRDNLDTLKLDDKGNFHYVFATGTPEECRILAGRSMVRMYLQPGEELTVSFNMAKPNEAPVYTGTQAAYSKYYEEFQKKETQLMQRTNQRYQANLKPARMLALEDSLLAVRTQLVNNYCDTQKLNDAFRRYQLKAMEYLCLAELAMYRRSSHHYSDETLSADREKLDIKLLSLPADNIEMLYCEHYQNYVRHLVSGTAAQSLQIEGPDMLPAYYTYQFDETVRLVKNQECLNYLLKELVVEAMKETGTRDIRSLVDRFNAVCTNEPMKKRVAKVWAPYLRMQAGSPCPVLENFTLDGQRVMMSELKGKVVYIDIWATWCGPCKKEIPSLKALEAQYHGKNIEFVSISVDKDWDAWRKFVADQQLSGRQWHQSDDLDKNISVQFAANSIPRFILLDEEGRIVSADAPRPSSGDVLRSLIDRVLND